MKNQSLAIEQLDRYIRARYPAIARYQELPTDKAIVFGKLLIRPGKPLEELGILACFDWRKSVMFTNTSASSL